MTFNTNDGFDHGGNLFVNNSPKNVTMSVAAEDSDDVVVTITLTDGKGDALTARAAIDFYLSDAADGLDITGTAPDGGLAVGTDQNIVEHTTSIAGILYSDASGAITLTVTESGTDAWYLNVVDAHGRVTTSDAMSFTA